MKLRLRLLLTTVAVAMPIAVALAWLGRALEERAWVDARVQFVIEAMQQGDRTACEADPVTFSSGRAAHEPPGDCAVGPPPAPPGSPPEGGRRAPPPPRRYVYRSDGTSRDPDAPRLDAEQVRGLRPGTGLILPGGLSAEPHHQPLLVRMPWDDGPCALVLVGHPTPPAFEGGHLFGPPVYVWLIILGSFVAGLLLAAEPVVRRVRRLTREVRGTALARLPAQLSTQGRDEIAELSRTFEEAGRELRAHLSALEQRETALREFVENTSHDVAIPLTVLQGELSSVMERLRAGEPVDGARVAAAMAETNYIASLLRNLSAAARIEAGQPGLQLEDLDLREVLGRVMGRHQSIARQAGVALEHALPPEPVPVRGDLTALEQAVGNVVYNAIRHNRRDGHVAVVLEHGPRGHFVLRVVDDGPGLGAEELEQLRTDLANGNQARRRGPSGHGLGLRITQELARLHGWALGLAPSAHGGLEVVLTGPCAAPPAPGR
ncbi:MAG TPA: HAMP domain-containing sensor histidine kinase [Myxococcota bacterium]|nr:HAMP domain-containing sensor histidine kinase [Myxococcota bacterium]HRY96496.1 HAMP domain-containing sensor histidine kinase [Myxococcota bacterium]HSA24438.1 HAMP domain-containing sensor histidine kinase [Myxococcota bacterium]